MGIIILSTTRTKPLSEAFFLLKVINIIIFLYTAIVTINLVNIRSILFRPIVSIPNNILGAKELVIYILTSISISTLLSALSFPGKYKLKIALYK